MTGYCDIFLDITSKVWYMKEIIAKLDIIKIKDFCSVKGTLREYEDKPQNGRKIFAKDISDKGLLPKIYKQLLKLNNKETIQFKNRQDLNRHLTKEDI